ncbi:hypothetical protein GCM10023115_05620 [Pontixanthobacter gangjinensis]
MAEGERTQQHAVAAALEEEEEEEEEEAAAAAEAEVALTFQPLPAFRTSPADSRSTHSRPIMP